MRMWLPESRECPEREGILEWRSVGERRARVTSWDRAFL